jgi:transposase-like protein
MITDKLGSYGGAKREVMSSVEHRQHKILNNRAENSHQPARRRERIMKCFNPRATLSDFLQPMARSTISFFAHPKHPLKIHRLRQRIGHELSQTHITPGNLTLTKFVPHP